MLACLPDVEAKLTMRPYPIAYVVGSTTGDRGIVPLRFTYSNLSWDFTP